MPLCYKQRRSVTSHLSPYLSIASSLVRMIAFSRLDHKTTFPDLVEQCSNATGVFRDIIIAESSS